MPLSRGRARSGTARRGRPRCGGACARRARRLDGAHDRAASEGAVRGARREAAPAVRPDSRGGHRLASLARALREPGAARPRHLPRAHRACRAASFRRVSAPAVRAPAEFEERLRSYVFERSEEGRAVRVGEKEVSEQAAIVARYADLFTRPQLEALAAAEAEASGDDRERLARLRLTCEEGLVDSELTEREDELENALLAARVP